MDGYVIVRREDGKFVTPPGSEKSFTSNLQKARVYPNKSTAESDCCVENESVRPVSDFINKS